MLNFINTIMYIYLENHFNCYRFLKKHKLNLFISSITSSWFFTLLYDLKFVVASYVWAIDKILHPIGITSPLIPSGHPLPSHIS